ncbi:MAG: nuclear transport factor 2 family protein [Dokdonella sp.]
MSEAPAFKKKIIGMSKKAAAIEFLTLAASGEVAEAYARYIAADFKHHNAHFAHDRQSLLDAMAQSAAAEPNKSFEIIQAFEESDTVAVHSRLTRVSANAQYAVVHILKFSDGKIAEMWDIAQEVPADSPNELGMF